MDVAESFPVQIGLEVEIENVGDRTDTVTFTDGCVVLMRVYSFENVVWDQGQVVGCPDVVVEVTLAPGEVETFRLDPVNAADVLGDSLPDGEYRVFGYLRPHGELELDAGIVDLAIPR